MSVAQPAVERPRPDFDISHYEHEGYHVLHARCGNRGVRRVVPPAGEDFAFTTTDWTRRVEVSVSPTGRSVRVWVDGQEVPVIGSREQGR